MSRLRDSATDQKPTGYGAADSSVNSSVSSSGAKQCDPPADAAAIADALAVLSEAERAGVIEHVKALVKLSARRRAAILTLTDPV